MSNWINLSIKGVQEEQARNLARIAALKPGGAISRAVRNALIKAHRYAVALTHVDTGTLRAAHRIVFRETDTYGFIEIDPSARNPRSHQLAADYGVYEHRRGGSHAFYGRVVAEYGDDIAREGVRIVLDEVTK
jgi:hypothetical protein